MTKSFWNKERKYYESASPKKHALCVNGKFLIDHGCSCEKLIDAAEKLLGGRPDNIIDGAVIQVDPENKTYDIIIHSPNQFFHVLVTERDILRIF